MDRISGAHYRSSSGASWRSNELQCTEHQASRAVNVTCLLYFTTLHKQLRHVSTFRIKPSSGPHTYNYLWKF
jgi:hypothetical protein